jgi:D-aspartate ligase
MRELHPPLTGVREPTPVLVLGVGITVLGTIRCLGRREIPLYVGTDPGTLVRRSRYFRALPVEGPWESGDAGLADRLAALPFERMVLLPTSDRWTFAVSRLPAALARRFPSTVATTEVLEKLIIKSRLACVLEKLQIPHPRTIAVPNLDAGRALPAGAFENAFLKPTQSGPFAAVYGAKALRFRGREDALARIDEASSRGFELMLQEFIPGPADRHYFVEGFIDRGGRVCGLLARRRIRIYPPDFGNSSATETIALSDVPDAVASLRRLLDGVGYRGTFSAEFKLDERDGLFKLLEVNVRPWWFAGFAARCGLDVCEMAYRDALGQDVQPVTRYAVGRRCVAPRLDLESGLAEWRAGRLGLAALFRSWIGADLLTLSRDDPWPGISGMFSWSKSRLRRKLGL